MIKLLSKWLRRFHRWIAIPTALAILTALLIKIVGDPEVVALWEKLDKIPSILMLIMAFSGAYLFLLPYIIKGRRKNNLRKRTLQEPVKTFENIETPDPLFNNVRTFPMGEPDPAQIVADGEK